jgi:hypothetical protein
MNAQILLSESCEYFGGIDLKVYFSDHSADPNIENQVISDCGLANQSSNEVIGFCAPEALLRSFLPASTLSFSSWCLQVRTGFNFDTPKPGGDLDDENAPFR